MNTLKKITLLTAALGLTASFSHAQSTERESYDEIDLIYDLIINADIDDLTLDNLNRALIEVAENPGLNPRDGIIDRDRPFGFDIDRRNGMKIDTGLNSKVSQTIDGRFSTVGEGLTGDEFHVYVFDTGSSIVYVTVHVLSKDTISEVAPLWVGFAGEKEAQSSFVSGLVALNDKKNDINIWISETEKENDNFEGIMAERAFNAAAIYTTKDSKKKKERTFWGGSDQEQPGQGPLNEDRPLNWGSLFDTIRIDPEFIGGSGDDLEKGPTPKNQGFGTIRMADEERFGDSKLHHYNEGVRVELELIISGGGSVDPTWSDDDDEGGAGGSWQPNGNPLGR